MERRMKPAGLISAVIGALAILALLPTAASAERVKIVRDAHAEPHIQARSAAGAAYGLAYAQMEDQATYLYASLAASTGRSAELIGPDCQPSLASCFLKDQLTHLFRIPESAVGSYGTLPRDSRERFKAFAGAMNDFAAKHPERVPSYAFEVTPQDVLANTQFPFVLSQVAAVSGIGATIDDGNGNGRRQSFAGFASDEGTVEQGASNGFVLAGSKTASGKPIVEGDPHLGFDGSARWYAAQISYPGTSVEGVTFRGGPGIAIGSNGEVAWTRTANHGNQNEGRAYVETLGSDDSNSYLYGGSYEPMEVRTVPIKVQASPGSVSTIDVRMRYTIHGPVISDPPATLAGTQPAPGPGAAVSATVSQYEQVGLATQLWAENEADSISEFRDAMDQNQLSGFHVLVADDSDVFYTSGGRNGILNPGLPLSGALDGSDPYQTWQGILPFDQVPQATNPPSGYYQNANNSPWYTAPGQIVESEVPYYLRKADTNGTRSRRQIQLLDPAQGVTLDEAGRIGMDNYVEFAPSLKALLAQAAVGAGPKVVAGNALIQAWDNRAEMNSTAYPLFATWVRGLDESVLGFKTPNPPPQSTNFTAAQISEARQSMVTAHDGMTAQYGTIAVRYGDLHTFTWGSFTGAVNGGDHDLATVRLTNCKGEPGALSPVYYHPCAVRGGSSYMFHVDMGNPGRMNVTRPVSDSDDPASAHYTDNARDYVADRYRAFPVTRKALADEQISSRRLRIPGTKPRKLSLRSKTAEVSRAGKVTIDVRCAARKGDRCRGKLRLTESGRGGGKGRRGKSGGKTIAAERFSLRRGKREVRAKLTRGARHDLARQGRLRANVTVTVKDLGDQARSRSRITLITG